MEKKKQINYDEIDELIRPVIKYLNDVMQVETIYSCQGLDADRRTCLNHSISGYIMCKYSQRTYKILNYVLDKTAVLCSDKQIECDLGELIINLNSIAGKVITLRYWTSVLPMNKHKALWKDVLECLKNYRYGKERKM